MGDYLNPEGREEETQDIGSSGRIEVTTHGDETGDVENVGTPEAPIENIPLPVASTKSTDQSAAETVFSEMCASEVPTPIEADAAEHTTTVNILTQGEAAGSEITFTTSISAGNN